MAPAHDGNLRTQSPPSPLILDEVAVDGLEMRPPPLKRICSGRTEGDLKTLTQSTKSAWTDLATETWHQIVSHLQPLDLLRLYHTSKQFHAFLKVPKGSHTTLEWTRARVNVPEYPPCPSWTTEPLFAALCFGPYLQKYITRVASVIPSIYVPGITGGQRYHLPHAEHLEAELADAATDIAQTAVLGNWARRASDAVEHARLCSQWQKECDDRRRRAIRVRTMARRTQIFKRLYELGFKKIDVDYLGRNYQALPDWAREFVNQPKDLSEQGKWHATSSPVDLSQRFFSAEWVEIRPLLEQFFSSRQALRIRLEERDAFIPVLEMFTSVMARHARRGSYEVAPHPVDMVHIPQVSQMLTSSSETQLDLDKLETVLPALISEWRENRARVRPPPKGRYPCFK
ncbi:hypothetical protein C8Q76DRAFT_799197 [Earliella scabrosa]|nr:hypothetical protein C8Q76DRAFT_799197 [Earliella scabrosa]